MITDLPNNSIVFDTKKAKVDDDGLDGDDNDEEDGDEQDIPAVDPFAPQFPTLNMKALLRLVRKKLDFKLSEEKHQLNSKWKYISKKDFDRQHLVKKREIKEEWALLVKINGKLKCPYNRAYEKRRKSMVKIGKHSKHSCMKLLVSFAQFTMVLGCESVPI